MTNHKAFLVSVSDNEFETPNLEFCNNDLALMTESLINGLGFRSENIFFLWARENCSKKKHL